MRSVEITPNENNRSGINIERLAGAKMFDDLDEIVENFFGIVDDFIETISQ